MSAIDQVYALLEAEDHKYWHSTQNHYGDDVFYLIAFDGIEFNNVAENPGGYPRYTATLLVPYVKDFIEQEKRLAEAALAVYPGLIDIAGGQVTSERVSWYPDPDFKDVPNKIGITLTFIHRGGRVSDKD